MRQVHSTRTLVSVITARTSITADSIPEGDPSAPTHLRIYTQYAHAKFISAHMTCVIACLEVLHVREKFGYTRMYVCRNVRNLAWGSIQCVRGAFIPVISVCPSRLPHIRGEIKSFCNTDVVGQLPLQAH
jgi:hypothetical protein